MNSKLAALAEENKKLKGDGELLQCGLKSIKKLQKEGISLKETVENLKATEHRELRFAIITGANTPLQVQQFTKNDQKIFYLVRKPGFSYFDPNEKQSQSTTGFQDGIRP